MREFDKKNIGGQCYFADNDVMQTVIVMRKCDLNNIRCIVSETHFSFYSLTITLFG